MKRQHTLFFILILLAACSKNELPNEQIDVLLSNQTDRRLQTIYLDMPVEGRNRGLLIDFSETWCPPCGTYGGPAFDSALYLEGNSITAIKVYGSSSPSVLNSSISNDWASGYGVVGVPDFWFNNTELNPGGGVYSSPGANYNWVNTKANAFAADSVVAGVALSKKMLIDSVQVKTKVKFFQAQPSGIDYRLAVYVVEDNIISNQSTNSGSNPNYLHRNLLRSCNSTSYSGVPINNSSPIASNQEFTQTFSLAKNSVTGNNRNLKVIAVIWKMGSTPAKVVNSNIVK